MTSRLFFALTLLAITSSRAADPAQTFHDLLPEKFRKQLRSAVPYLITNQDATTGAYQITFTAEAWEDVGSSSPDWVSHNFVFEQTGTEEPTIRSVRFAKTVESQNGTTNELTGTIAQTPEGVADRSLKAGYKYSW